MIRASQQHLREAGESYAEHMRFAATVGLMTAGAGLACLLHSIVPALCQKTCSRTVGHLQQLFADRRQLDRVQAEAEGVSSFVLLLLIAATSAALVLVVGAASPVAAVVAAMALAFPLVYLATNPELKPEDS
jgi:hypothetical protein